ncbi:hypothetical protein E5Q_01593 [Mixia osmundae IAM 14324]|uniref:Metallo-beta-lactamase domain-containing protein n=1 Tax=Mixia osmundae (strain CBS 9802 / IAM 14324 / JCM 22182 / KY 12970) TaxID=764103 RepID=G7DWH8_MIXOS|nr:hypothetical protein E5Q_01593 [Mixia osmundae IAM 14324]
MGKVKTPKPDHHHASGGFKNPWPSADGPGVTSLFSRFPLELISRLDESEVRQVNVVPCRFDDEGKAGSEKLRATWLGHAGVLVQLPAVRADVRSIRILFDPIFSYRSSPVGFIGPARRQESPCTVEDLPEIDILCLTHNHYDHMDLETLDTLRSRFPDLMFCVPLGNRAWLEEMHVASVRIRELDWWQSDTLSLASILPAPEKEKGEIQIHCVPAQHSSGRGLFDQNATLWCGWVVEQIHDGKRCAVFTAGDTGYRGPHHDIVCPAFKEIGQKHGPIDLAFIPIWRGGSLSFVSTFGLRLKPYVNAAHHCTPDDALRLHQDVQARHSIAIHHACFVGSEDEARWPTALFLKAKAKLDIPEWDQEGGFGIVDMNVIETLFGRAKTPAERMRQHQRSLQKAQRELDRERTKLEAQEKKLVADIRKNAKAGQMGSCKVMAKDLVRTRRYISKFYAMRTQLQAVSLRLQTMRSNQQMAEAMKGATRAMSGMSRNLNIPAMQRILMEFEKESSSMDMKEEMMSDAVDDVMEDDGETEEEEGDKILKEVLDEIGISVSQQLGEAPTSLGPVEQVSNAQQRIAVGEGVGASLPTTSAGAPDTNLGNEFGDLQSRLDSLRKP